MSPKLPKSYRWVRVGEKLRTGDKIWFNGAWEKIHPFGVGCRCMEPKFYRRRITKARTTPTHSRPS